MRLGLGFSAAAAVLLLLPSCDSPAEPLQGNRVPVNQVIEASFDNDTVPTFSFVAAAGLHAVFLESSQSSIQLWVRDSATQQVIRTMYAGPSGPPLDLNVTESFVTTAGQVFYLEVRAYPSASGGAFRFLVYRVNFAPEHKPARFEIGDTVSGESLDGVADMDDFVVAGLTGREYVAVIEALAPGQSALAMIVYDSGAQYPLPGSTTGAAGFPATSTTGRLRFFTTRDHRFRFMTVTGPSQLYRGPYRFWSYEINRRPEHLPRAAPVGQVVVGEKIDRAGDVDEFALAGSAGREFNAFAQASRPFQLQVVANDSFPWADAFVAMSADPADTGLFANATGRFALPNDGPYRVRVVGAPDNTPIADTGVYRFYIYPINRAPEHRPAAITLGDTVSETIDMPGDVDEFTFSGTPGDEYSALFQAANGSEVTELRLEALDAAGNVVRDVQGFGSDTGLFQHNLGRLTLPGNGAGRLRVRGGLDRTDRDIGPYRLVAYRINRLPESSPSVLALGDSVMGEAIDVPGDIDEYGLTILEPRGVSIVLGLGSEATEGMRLDVFDHTGAVVIQGPSAGPGTEGVAGHYLPAGTYTVRVHERWAESQSLLRSSYRLWTYGFGTGPEVASDTIAIGDTVSGEGIEVVGDVDRLWFYGVQGQRINIAFQGVADAVTGGFSALFFAPHPRMALVTPTRADSLGSSQSARIDLLSTGWYWIDVGGWSSELRRGNTGPYRLAITQVPVQPEVTGATLVAGDSVVTEVLDYPGDVDEYTIIAPAGQRIALVTQRPSTRGLQTLVFDSSSRTTLAAGVLNSLERVHHFRMPSSGRARIAVFEPEPATELPYCGDPTCGGRYSQTAGFKLLLAAVNPAPETASAAPVIGDTVAEALSPGTDLDEFTVSATPFEALTGWFQLDQAPVPAGRMIRFEVVDPVGGGLLTNASITISEAGSYFHVEPFLAPASGLIQLRVYGHGTEPVYGFGTEPALAEAPYRFFFRRGQ